MRLPLVVRGPQEVSEVSEPPVHRALAEQAFHAVSVAILASEVRPERPEERVDQVLVAPLVLEEMQVD